MAHHTELMALDPGPQDELEPEVQDYFRKCEEKLGFVPNVFRAYAFSNAKLRAFIDMADDLMLGDSGLTKAEREMIAVVVSAINHCHYCLTSHGAALRQRSDDPEFGEVIAQNYRAAGLDARQKAMLDFATRLTEEPGKIEESDRAALEAQASRIATSGTSRQSPASTTCRTGWQRQPTSAPTGNITIG